MMASFEFLTPGPIDFFTLMPILGQGPNTFHSLLSQIELSSTLYFMCESTVSGLNGFYVPGQPQGRN